LIKLLKSQLTNITIPWFFCLNFRMLQGYTKGNHSSNLAVNLTIYIV
jgi:hypothetical protein